MTREDSLVLLADAARVIVAARRFVQAFEGSDENAEGPALAALKRALVEWDKGSGAPD